MLYNNHKGGCGKPAVFYMLPLCFPRPHALAAGRSNRTPPGCPASRSLHNPQTP